MTRPTAEVRSLAGRYWPAGGVDSEVFRARFPVPGELIEMARSTAQGRVRFWHPWHMERTTVAETIGRRIVWSAAPNGDREWPHALARCSHLVDLAAAHAMTGAPELLESWADHVTQLAHAREAPPSRLRVLIYPYERELWSNHLDAAIRLVNMIRSYDLVRGAQGLPEPVHDLAIGVMRRDADDLIRGLGRRVGNWEVFIPSAVVLASIYLRRIVDTAEWKTRAASRLAEILNREIGPDGIMAEQVPMYQGVCALALLDTLVACRSNDLEPDPAMSGAATRMIDALRRLADPLGRIPTIGDSDAFDVAYLETFASAVLGTRAAAGPDPIDRHGVSLSVMPSVGWAVARWRGGTGEPGYLLFDASGRPPITHAGHSHADDLQLLVHDGSGPLLVDPGRFTYAPGFQPHLPFVGRALSPRGRFDALNKLFLPRFRQLNERDWRAYFRSTLAHNTISAGGRNQPGYGGTGDDSSKVQLTRAVKKTDVVFLTGSAEGKDSRAIRHERIVVCAVPELLVVVDILESTDKADWIASFHAGVDVEARLVEGGAVELTRAGRNARRLAFVAVGDGKLDIAVEDDWVSPEYNVKQKSRTVRATIRGADRPCLISALTLDPATPGSKAEASGLRVEAVSPDGADGPVVKVSFGATGAGVEVFVNPRRRPIRLGASLFESVAIVRRSSPAGESVTEL